MCAVATCVHDTLRYSFMIEMKYLFPKVKILEQRRPSLADLQRILIVRNRAALGRCQNTLMPLGNLVKFTSIPPD